jgi:hypothetical protein
MSDRVKPYAKRKPRRAADPVQLGLPWMNTDFQRVFCRVSGRAYRLASVAVIRPYKRRGAGQKG